MQCGFEIVMQSAGFADKGCGDGDFLQEGFHGFALLVAGGGDEIYFCGAGIQEAGAVFSGVMLGFFVDCKTFGGGNNG